MQKFNAGDKVRREEGKQGGSWYPRGSGVHSVSNQQQEWITLEDGSVWDAEYFFLVTPQTGFSDPGDHDLVYAAKGGAVPPKALSTQVGGDHYKSMVIQPIEYITKNNLGWCEGNIVKYITRWKQKGGKADIDKVIHYANLLKELN
jgi:hypothetical protein